MRRPIPQQVAAVSTLTLHAATRARAALQKRDLSLRRPLYPAPRDAIPVISQTHARIPDRALRHNQTLDCFPIPAMMQLPLCR
jgi:hypothetical protein